MPCNCAWANVVGMCRESAVSTWHGISSANQIKASNFGSRIPILHANLELGPSFSHILPQEFLLDTILKFFSFFARRYTLYKRIGLRVQFFPPHVATQGFMRRLAEDHGKNLLFKTRFMNNLLLLIGRKTAFQRIAGIIAHLLALNFVNVSSSTA